MVIQLWQITELGLRDRFPTEAYEDADPRELLHVLSQLNLLRIAGCPPDKEKGNPNVQRWKKYRVAKPKYETMVWVLKAKPTRWRLYFHIPSVQARQIELLHVVSKKEDPRDPKDFDRCCYVLARRLDGETKARLVEIPETP